MEAIAFLLILVIVLIGCKILGLVFQTGVFLFSIPLQILMAIAIAVLLFTVVPVGLVGGLLAFILIPFGIVALLLPIFLIGLGLYFITRR